MVTIDQIDRSRIPQHVAIIMDGNGRWAMRQQHERIFGHQSAMTAVRQAVEAGVQLGVRYLTLYTFSTENWNRPQAEIDGLMELLIKAVHEETKTLMDNNVRLSMIGDLQRIPERSRATLQGCMDQTAGNTAMTLILALSYSSRWEIAQALKGVVRDAQAGRLGEEQVDEETLRNYLVTKDYPDPDLLIRTGGELRVSNFLLWPDFRRGHFYQAVYDYQQRQRRYGKTEAQVEEEA